jgi:hypothetical protein
MDVGGSDKRKCGLSVSGWEEKGGMQVCIYAGGCWRMQELQMKGASSWWWKAYLSALCNSPQIGSGGELAPARRMFGGQGWHGQGQRAVAPWGLGRYGISDGGDRTALPIRIENEHGGKGAEMQQQRQPFLGGEGRCYTPYRPLQPPTSRRAAA